MRLRYKTIWLSDIHLGTRDCKAEYLLDFLNHIECESLYLVGDIIDFWKLKSGWHWLKLHSDVVFAVLKLAQNGTRVIYIPGNHDEILRDYIGNSVQGIEILENDIYQSLNGQSYLVLHGDEYDGVVCNNKWLAYLGTYAYDALLLINRWFNLFRRKCGFPYWSLSAHIKHSVKNAVNFIYQFESVLALEAKKKGVDGIICGHIHHAVIRNIDDTLTYCNTGDWVESCTALTEDLNGKFSIIYWTEQSVHLLDNNQSYEINPDKRRLATSN